MTGSPENRSSAVDENAQIKENLSFWLTELGNLFAFERKSKGQQLFELEERTLLKLISLKTKEKTVMALIAKLGKKITPRQKRFILLIRDCLSAYKALVEPKEFPDLLIEIFEFLQLSSLVQEEVVIVMQEVSPTTPHLYSSLLQMGLGRAEHDDEVD